MILRDYQDGAISALSRGYELYRSQLLALPTGGGKTVIFAEITRRCVARGKTVLIIVHRRELVSQCSAALHDLGVSHGLIQAGRTPNLRESVQIASVQTLARRCHTIAAPDLVVFDEAHHCAAGTWSKVYHSFADRGSRVLGVTATPMRLDGAGLGRFFSNMVVGPTTAELIRDGFLSQIRLYQPPGLDVTGIRRRAGDYAADDVAVEMTKQKIYGNAADHYLSRVYPGSAIAFCVTVAHAEMFAADLRGRGVRAVSIDGSMRSEERADCISGLGDGRYDVLTSCEIVSEGTDIPSVTAAILLRPTASLGLYLQQVGRSLRVSPGKTAAIIMDHVGNSTRHGWPDDERDWTLDGGCVTVGAKKLPQPVICDVCFAANRPGAGQCSECGATLVSKKELPQVDCDVDLVEAQRLSVTGRRGEERSAQSLDDFRAIARKRGYKQRWAEIRWALRQQRGQNANRS